MPAPDAEVWMKEEAWLKRRRTQFEWETFNWVAGAAPYCPFPTRTG